MPLQINFLHIVGTKDVSTGWTFPLTDLNQLVKAGLAKDMHAPSNHMRLEVHITRGTFEELQVAFSLLGGV